MARTNYEVNRQKTRVPMPELDPVERAQTFDEVALGYSEEEAVAEARRCIQCPNAPCVGGCPVGVPIPQFIAQVAEGNFARAYAIVKSANSLPAICGRVCPQETQCEGVCTRGKNGEPVSIGRLERFTSDWAFEHPEEAAAAMEEFACEGEGLVEQNEAGIGGKGAGDFRAAALAARERNGLVRAKVLDLQLFEQLVEPLLAHVLGQRLAVLINLVDADLGGNVLHGDVLHLTVRTDGKLLICCLGVPLGSRCFSEDICLTGNQFAVDLMHTAVCDPAVHQSFFAVCVCCNDLQCSTTQRLAVFIGFLDLDLCRKVVHPNPHFAGFVVIALDKFALVIQGKVNVLSYTVTVRCRHFVKRILSNRKHLDIMRFLTRRPAFYFIAFLIQNR